MSGSDLFEDEGAGGLEGVADGRPGPMFRGVDRYFDEPEKDDGRAAGLVGWAARAGKGQREGLLRFSQWCAAAPDGERRAVMVLIDRYGGRTPAGCFEETARLAGVNRRTVTRAVKRFTGFFPGAISAERRRVDSDRNR